SLKAPRKTHAVRSTSGRTPRCERHDRSPFARPDSKSLSQNPLREGPVPSPETGRRNAGRGSGDAPKAPFRDGKGTENPRSDDGLGTPRHGHPDRPIVTSRAVDLKEA